MLPKQHNVFDISNRSVLLPKTETHLKHLNVAGILHVGSRPKGLHFPNGFTTGTTQEIIGYYSESCCRPDLELVVYDRQHNRVTKKINAYCNTIIQIFKNFNIQKNYFQGQIWVLGQ